MEEFAHTGDGPVIAPGVAGRTEVIAATTGTLGLSHPDDGAQESQYVVVTEIDGVVNEVPVPNTDPPNWPAYHLSVPDEQPEPVRVTVPGPHREAPVPTGVVEGDPVTVRVIISLYAPAGHWVLVILSLK